MRDLNVIAENCYNAVNDVDGGKYTPWSALRDRNQSLTIEGVKFLFKNPKATPEDVHNNWVKCRTELGWKYGKEFNVSLKTNPSMQSYDKLEADNKAKDIVFITAFKASVNVLRYKKKASNA